MNKMNNQNRINFIELERKMDKRDGSISDINYHNEKGQEEHRINSSWLRGMPEKHLSFGYIFCMPSENCKNNSTLTA